MSHRSDLPGGTAFACWSSASRDNPELIPCHCTKCRYDTSIVALLCCNLQLRRPERFEPNDSKALDEQALRKSQCPGHASSDRAAASETIPWEAQSQTTAGRPHTRPRWDCGTGPPAPPGSRIPWDMHCSPCADSSGSRRCTTALQSAAQFTEDPPHLLTETVPSRCSLPGSLQTSSLIAQMRAGAQVAFLYDKCLSEFECLQVKQQPVSSSSTEECCLVATSLCM